MMAWGFDDQRSPCAKGAELRTLAAIVGVLVVAVVALLVLHTRPRIVGGESYGGRTLSFEVGNAVNTGLLERYLNSQEFFDNLRKSLAEHPLVTRCLSSPVVNLQAREGRNGSLYVNYHVPLYSVRDFDLLRFGTAHGIRTEETDRLNAEVEAIIVKLVQKAIEHCAELERSGDAGRSHVFESRKVDHTLGRGGGAKVRVHN